MVEVIFLLLYIQKNSNTFSSNQLEIIWGRRKNIFVLYLYYKYLCNVKQGKSLFIYFRLWYIPS